MSDEYAEGFIKGIAIITKIEDVLYEWIYIGLDSGYFISSHKGTTYFNDVDEFWVCDPYGEIESTFYKVNNMYDETYINSAYYPSTLGVKSYVKKQFEEKLVPIDIDVGDEHAENEYYNANAVDAVLIEVVGIIEEMSSYIEQFAMGLDDLTSRVEALEGN